MIIVCSVLTVVVLALGWIIFNKRAGSRYRVLDSIEMQGMRFRRLHAPFLDLFDREAAVNQKAAHAGVPDTALGTKSLWTEA